MNNERLDFKSIQKKKGQSLVELAMILLVLLTLLTGMVEFGNLLNQYINIVDGAREGARFGSNDDPFAAGNEQSFYAKIYTIVQGDGTENSKGAINPIVLDKTIDDIIVSVFSVTSHPDGTVSVVRFTDPTISVNHTTNIVPHTSKFTDAQVANMLDSNAPSSGVLLVEVFYGYHQILRLYSILGIPDPIQLHAYSIMPLSAAEPTPTPH